MCTLLMFWHPLAELHRDCAKKRSGNYPALTYRFCPNPASLIGSFAIDFLRNLIGTNNCIMNSMFVLEEFTV